MKWSLKAFEELSIDELYAILALRTEVFVVEQECFYQEVDHKDQVSLHLCAYDQEDLVAYARLLPKGVSFSQASIGRVLVAKNYRGQNLARQLMERAISYIQEDMGENEIQISAQEYLDSFYRSLGFKPVSEVYLEDGIPHQDMILNLRTEKDT